MVYEWQIEKYKNVLNPCPFCGGQAVISQIGNDHTRNKKLEIKCTRCHIKKTKKVLKLSWDWLEEQMIKDWNTRKRGNTDR